MHQFTQPGVARELLVRFLYPVLFESKLFSLDNSSQVEVTETLCLICTPKILLSFCVDQATHVTWLVFKCTYLYLLKTFYI